LLFFFGRAYNSSKRRTHRSLGKGGIKDHHMPENAIFQKTKGYIDAQ
jgi:hypothetical protein